MEIKPDWGCDSGLFLRSNEAGNAYQVTLDYLPGGRMGGIYGEGLKGLTNVSKRSCRPKSARSTPAAGRKRGSGKRGTPCARGSRGTLPQDHRLDQRSARHRVQDTANHAADGAADGMIAIQMHFSDPKVPRWVDGGFWRWRTIAVKELPAK